MTFFEDIELLLRPLRCNCFGLLWLLKKAQNDLVRVETKIRDQLSKKKMRWPKIV